MPRALNLAGHRFGRLVPISVIAGSRKCKRKWLCRCNCGNEHRVEVRNLLSGDIQSCGCLKHERSIGNRHGVTHGLKDTAEYRAWAAMKSRCLNPHHQAYRNYGARGITVCAQWYKFENFYRDMGPRPMGLELDRINNNQGYFKENCRWATRSENQKNIRKELRFKFPIYRGMDNRASKLTEAQRHMIGTLFRLGGYTKRKLAILYGVTPTRIGQIINRP